MGVSLRIFWAMEESAGKAGLSGKSWIKSRPSSRLRVSWGSRGTEPGGGGQGEWAVRARLGGPVHPLSPGARGQHWHGPAGLAPSLNLPKTPSRPHGVLGAPAEGNTGRLQLEALAGRGEAGWEEAPSSLSPGAALGQPRPTHPGRGRQRVSPAPRRLPWRRRWCTPGTQRHRVHLLPLCWRRGGGPPTPATAQDSPSSEGRQSHSCSPRAQSPAAPPSCRRSAPASRPPRTPPGGRERGGGGRWVPRKQPRWARREGRLPRGEGALREQYLGRGDHEGPQGTVGAQGVHHGHVLVRGAWGRVHNQVVQLPPGHVGHKLLYQRCRNPGRLGVGGSGQAGRVSPGPHTLLAPGRGNLWVLGPLAFGELCVPLHARGETLPQPPGLQLGP